MNNYFILILKGFIIGLGKIIPGVSGALLAITLKVYDISIEAISHFFNNPKRNIYILSSLSIGIIISIIFFSKLISELLNIYPFFTMIFFLGLILGTIPSIFNEVKTKQPKTILISFLICTALIFPTANNIYIIQNNYIDYIIFFVAGLLEAIGTVVPGISSTALLLLLGVYKDILIIIGDITNINCIIKNLSILIPFTGGLLIGIILTTLLISYLFKNYKTKVYNVIFGICLSTVLLLIYKTFSLNITYLELIISPLLLITGIIIGYILDR